MTSRVIEVELPKTIVSQDVCHGAFECNTGPDRVCSCLEPKLFTCLLLPFLISMKTCLSSHCNLIVCNNLFSSVQADNKEVCLEPHRTLWTWTFEWCWNEIRLWHCCMKWILSALCADMDSEDQGQNAMVWVWFVSPEPMCWKPGFQCCIVKRWQEN